MGYNNIIKTIDKYKTTKEEIKSLSRYQLKRKLQETANTIQTNNLLKVASEKSKVKHVVENRNQEEVLAVPTYINSLSRRDCENIFAVRTRMVWVKTTSKMPIQIYSADGVKHTKKHKNTYSKNVKNSDI